MYAERGKGDDEYARCRAFVVFQRVGTERRDRFLRRGPDDDVGAGV